MVTLVLKVLCFILAPRAVAHNGKTVLLCDSFCSVHARGPVSFPDPCCSYITNSGRARNVGGKNNATWLALVTGLSRSLYTFF